VRGRHAHAWCLAYLDDRWQEVDTTPGTWVQREAERAAFWEPFYDLLSNAWFSFAIWRESGSPWRLYVFGIGLAGLAYIGYRQMRGSRWHRTRPRDGRRSSESRWPGLDSAFYRIERLLERRLTPRNPGEPLGVWARRLPATVDDERRKLEALIATHYRLRFDPEGLDTNERRQFDREVEAWIEAYRREPPNR